MEPTNLISKYNQIIGGNTTQTTQPTTTNNQNLTALKDVSIFAK